MVIEYGGTDWGPFIQMPAALSYPMSMARYDWGFHSEPEPHLGGRRLATPRGKVLGGSSSINGMVYVRGHPRDFDTWAEMGADGLVLRRRAALLHPAGELAWRAFRLARRCRAAARHPRPPRDNPLYHSFVEAGAQAGFELTYDYNGQKQEGFGPMEQTVWRGRRWSVANAYLRPALRRGNVRVVSGLAARVVIEDGRATAVESSRARRQMIAAPARGHRLRLVDQHAEAPHAVGDRPGGASRRARHRGRRRPARCRAEPAGPPGDVFPDEEPEAGDALRVYNYPGMARIGAQWLFAKMGSAPRPVRVGGLRAVGAGVEYPDIQYHFLPLAVRYDGKSAVRATASRPTSGRCARLARHRAAEERRPAEAPAIRFNYMETAGLGDFRRCIRLTRELFAQPAFAPYAGDEIQPGAACRPTTSSTASCASTWRAPITPAARRGSGGATIRWRWSIPECRVIGVEGLRVADSSIFPRITNGNLNAPSIMVGEKAADHILGRRLPPSKLKPWINPRWRELDR